LASRQEVELKTGVQDRRVLSAIPYESDVNAASMGPRVNAVAAGTASNCFIEIFRMDSRPLSLATIGPFKYAFRAA